MPRNYSVTTSGWHLATLLGCKAELRFSNVLFQSPGIQTCPDGILTAHAALPVCPIIAMLIIHIFAHKLSCTSQACTGIMGNDYLVLVRIVSGDPNHHR